MKYFAAIIEDPNTLHAIYGIGHTEEEAIRDAIAWSGGSPEEYTVYPCDKGTYYEVQVNGGSIDFRIKNGRIISE